MAAQVVDWRSCFANGPDGFVCTQRIYDGAATHEGAHVAEGRAEGEPDRVVATWGQDEVYPAPPAPVRYVVREDSSVAAFALLAIQRMASGGCMPHDTPQEWGQAQLRAMVELGYIEVIP